MSDTPKPWFMFNKENHDNNNDNDNENEVIDRLINDIQAKIDALSDEDDDSILDDDTDYSDESVFDDDCTTCDKKSIEDPKFDYINGKLSVFPESASLIWSAVYLALKNERPILADEYFKKLIAIPIKKHDFNTIVSEIQYMLSDPFGRETQIRKCVRFLKKKYPSKEEGIFYEGILEERLGNWDKSVDLFKSAVLTYKRAPRSAEHLSCVLLDAGEYEEVIKYVKLADMMSTSRKPIVNMSVLDFNLYLAKDSLLKQRGINGENITTDDVDELRRSYEKLKIDHSELKNDSELQNRINKLNSLRSELEK